MPFAVSAPRRTYRGRSGTGSLLGVAGVVLLLLPHQVHQLPVPRVRVHPQVPPVKVVPLYGIGCLCPLLRGVVPARVVPVRFVVLLPVGLYRAAGRRAQYAVQHLVRQLLAVHRTQLPCAAAHPAGIRAALRQLHPGLQGASRCHPHPATAPALRHTVAYPVCLVLLFLVVFLPPVHLLFGSRFCLRRVVAVHILLILVLSLVIAAPLRHLCFCHCHSVLLYFSVPIAYAISSSEYPCNRRLL